MKTKNTLNKNTAAGTIYDLLTGNDLRSIGKSNEVVVLVTSDPELFDEVFDGIFHEDKVIRARCADAVEKVAKRFPEYIQKKKKIIIKNLDKFNSERSCLAHCNDAWIS